VPPEVADEEGRNNLLWGSIVVVSVVVVLSLSLKGSIGLQWIVSGLTLGAIYSLVAMGFSIIYSGTRVINFAQGEFSMLGGMLMYTFSVQAGMPTWLSFLLAVMLVTLLGAAFERAAIYPMRNASVVTVIIITIGFSIFIRAVSKWAWGTDPVKIASFSGEDPLRFFGTAVVPQSFWVLGLTVIAVVLVFFFFNRTLVGKGMRAVAANPDAAGLVGVSSSVNSLLAWTMAAALGAAAGIVIAPINFAAYSFGVMLGLKGFAAAVLGGLGSAPGAVIGGLVLGVLETIVAGVFPSGYKDAVAFVILILVLLIRPQGLMGRVEAEKV
jgi:branched-chain amino acid transport system permease protein